MHLAVLDSRYYNRLLGLNRLAYRFKDVNRTKGVPASLEFIKYIVEPSTAVSSFIGFNNALIEGLVSSYSVRRELANNYIYKGLRRGLYSLISSGMTAKVIY